MVICPGFSDENTMVNQMLEDGEFGLIVGLPEPERNEILMYVDFIPYPGSAFEASEVHQTAYVFLPKAFCGVVIEFAMTYRFDLDRDRIWVKFSRGALLFNANLVNGLIKPVGTGDYSRTLDLLTVHTNVYVPVGLRHVLADFQDCVSIGDMVAETPLTVSEFREWAESFQLQHAGTNRHRK
jgi:hypothetical protein